MQAEDTEKVRALELKRLKEQLRQEFEKETFLLRKAQEQDKAAEAVKAMLLAEVNNQLYAPPTHATSTHSCFSRQGLYMWSAWACSHGIGVLLFSPRS